MSGTTTETGFTQPALSYFDEITGLRLYLAVWVALSHGLQLSGYLKRSNPLTAVLLDGNGAVILFMIVSGFVITNLLIVKREAYGPYIVRRFARLFPAFAVASAIGFAIVAPWAELVRAVPWQDAPGWRDYAASIASIADETRNNATPHVAMHLTMLHGVLPVEVLDRSASTLLPAAWSVSLEWQFYLVAPLVIACLPSRPALIALAAGFGALLVAAKLGWLGTYQTDALLLYSSPWFAIGIASRLWFDKLRALPLSPVAVIAVAWMLIVGLSSRPLPLLVWSGFFAILLWAEPRSALRQVFTRLTTAMPVRQLGEASYSLYLIHRPVQVLVGAWLISRFGVGQPAMLAGQVAAIVLALPLSLAMYHGIERPGIRLGHRLARRFERQRTAPGRLGRRVRVEP